MTLLGVSSGVLADRTDLAGLLAYEPDVVEFYNYPRSMLGTIGRFCDRHGIRPALHTPVPYDEPRPLRRFAPTGPDPDEAAAALRMTGATVRCAADLGALHVVVHFPSPYPPYPAAGFDSWCRDFLDAACGLAREHGVLVLVENLSAHPLLHSAADYRDALAGRPELGLCLDLGHAHLLGPRQGPLAYAQALGPAVRSMHLYNTTAARYPEHGHEPARPGQSAAAGYLPIAEVLPELLALTGAPAVVLEHRPLAAGDPEPGEIGRWIRSVIGRRRPGPPEEDGPPPRAPDGPARLAPTGPPCPAHP
ncbi:sugar phosphate isomerase/epimerase family protein [Streptomyces incarnatus]|uniref:sugar phosphate isomerase/epimerase family protein n=1 Tax=Streptomyces sp. WP-1 TaxID=3041497 RepID=UPI00264760F1|nr:TIM barrel protein [Streptomyces sp. WP-1]WKE71622.1 TIM barrel protein [Streptomyces sp. WP-1]